MDLDTRIADPHERHEWARLNLARTLAAHLIAYRADQGLTLEELADRLSLHPDEMLALETGEVAPSFDVLCRVAAVLEIQIEVSIAPARMERLGFYPQDWASSEVPVHDGSAAKVHARILRVHSMSPRKPWNGWCGDVEGRLHSYRHVPGTDSIDKCEGCGTLLGK